MMGATVSGVPGLDLKTVTDASVYGERLKALTSQSEQAVQAYEQAKAENQAMVIRKGEAEALNDSTMALLNKNLALEQDLKNREGALEDRRRATADGEFVLANAKQKFAEESNAVKEKLDTREHFIAKREVEIEKQLAASQDELNKQFAALVAKAETKQRQALDAAVKAAEKAAVRERVADAAAAASDKKRLEYEEKLGSLKKLVG